MSRHTSANDRQRAGWRRLRRDDRGATLVEFTVVMGLLFAITFGIVEFALVLWEYNSAEKATHAGVRYAVESDPAASAFADFSGIDAGFEAGQDLDLSEIGAFTIVCDDSGCNAAPGDNCTNAGTDFCTYDSAAFDQIVCRIRGVYPQVQADQVEIDYSHVGFGFAGRPGGDLVPNVTVRLQGLTYDFVTMGALTAGALQQIDMPPFTATLTGEDLDSCGPGESCTPPACS